MGKGDVVGLVSIYCKTVSVFAQEQRDAAASDSEDQATCRWSNHSDAGQSSGTSSSTTYPLTL